jgi:hypothetical protein
MPRKPNPNQLLQRAVNQQHADKIRTLESRITALEGVVQQLEKEIDAPKRQPIDAGEIDDKQTNL